MKINKGGYLLIYQQPFKFSFIKAILFIEISYCRFLSVYKANNFSEISFSSIGNFIKGTLISFKMVLMKLN